MEIYFTKQKKFYIPATKFLNTFWELKSSQGILTKGKVQYSTVDLPIKVASFFK
jgi:hypothetical protein